MRFIARWSSVIPVICALGISSVIMSAEAPAQRKGLWSVYETALKNAKYVDLTHTITPGSPVWAGFAAPTFAQAHAGSDVEGLARRGDAFTYEKHGFEATE